RGLERREPRGRLDDVIVRGLVAVGAARAKAVGRAVDEPGVDGAERLVLEAEPRRWSGPEVVQDDVGGRREPEQRAASGGLLGSGTTSGTTGVIRRAATRRAACATSQREAYRDPMMLISACTMLRGATSVTTPGNVVRRTSRPRGPSASRQAPRVCAVPTRSIATPTPPGATARTQSERSGVSASSAASAPNSLTALSLWVPRSI